MNKKTFSTEYGIKLIVEKIPDVNVVSIFFVVKTGSCNEAKGKEGVSHFLEHMLFKGNKKFSSLEITETIEALGGSINAYTSLDETAYYVNILKENWQKGFDVLGSMVLEPLFDEKEFENERKVIMEELKGGYDNPFKVLTDETFKICFKNHPYSKPIIGFEESIRNLTINDLIDYYENFYIPENILIVAVGDIEPEETANTIEKLLENFSISRSKNNPVFPANNIIISENFETKVITRDVNQNYMNVTFRFPGGYFKEFPETYILCSLLGEFNNSLLKETLKEQLRLVTEITSYFYVCKNYSLFIINVLFPVSTSPEKVSNKILEEINNFGKRKITYEQIYKSIINHKADIIYNKESVANEARNIVFYEVITGDCENEEKFLKAIEKTDEKKIKAVCKKYFKNPVITLVTPYKTELKTTLSSKKAHKRFSSKRRLIKLDNGIRLIMEKNTRLPILTFNAVALGGLKFENSGNNGITYLMGNLLTKGSRNHSKKEIYEKFEFYSGAVEAFGAKNSFGIQGMILDEFFYDSFKIIKDAMLNPSFLDTEIEKEKNIISEKIIAENDDPATVALKKFYEILYSGSYYGMPLKGTIANLRKLKREDIVSHHLKLAKSENLVFGVTGNINGSIIDFLISELSDIPHETFETKLTPLEPVQKRNEFQGRINKNQSHIICGISAPPVSHEDSVKLTLLETILGNHSGKLFCKLREELGLCYSTSAFYMKSPETGAFGMYIATSPENEEIAVEKIKELIIELQKYGISDIELEKARNYIKGRMENSKQKFLNINTRNVYNVLYGLGTDYDAKYLAMLNSATKEHIRETAVKYFDFDKMTYITYSNRGVC